jgi:hypothetical protein
MHSHLNVKFFKSIYNFKMNLPINKKFGNMSMVLKKKKTYYTYHNYSCINYKVQYECEWDPMIFTNCIICTSIIKFL